jgi:hypothetical protein
MAKQTWQEEAGGIHLLRKTLQKALNEVLADQRFYDGEYAHLEARIVFYPRDKRKRKED